MTQPSITPLPNPLGLTAAAFADACAGSGLAGPRDRWLGLYASFYRRGPGEVEAWRSVVPPIGRTLVTHSPEGPVTKFLLPVPGVPRLGDAALETESVVIPMRSSIRTTLTLCVSSQVGCAMGCTFCETAQMGLLRSLTPAEIVQQWYAARHGLGRPIKNIVFMGMGEPLDNAENVLAAIEVLTDHRGPSVAMSHITVSTVGRTDGLAMMRERVLRQGWRQLNLAVSINAPNDEIRSRIMPINRAVPLGQLIPVLRDWPLRANGHICAEYVLIPGINDGAEHAAELALLLRGVRCCVNVIPYNPRRGSPWEAPTEDSVQRFLSALQDAGQYCKRRRTKGRDTMAACGQLGNERIRQRKLVDLRVAAE
ncbi:MAG: 23S rRNA (adenine(2503)-C(2))-methyltransferase RlmN [Phycisphaerales bacterium]|nr:23S rRNA (adenine(2503)-C(2))-methyltransferase RlmN [Phycisphaerales bacterium]